MNPLIVVFLGVIALGALVQAALLAALAVFTVRANRRLTELHARARTQIPLWGQKTRDATRRAAALSETARSFSVRHQGAVDAGAAGARKAAVLAVALAIPRLRQAVSLAGTVRSAVRAFRGVKRPGAPLAMEASGSRR
jgi:hypothetical protein